ncbi:hypothetical protein [Caulobacter sp. Root1472]|uniref:hypothetical protein n=1 Tax=Caulobacter sp. Root1472 TaxID=1736470 RepID=UPI000A490085|nr:hypothetical protein [Caulobacter sp. Root1472]
MTTRHRRGGLSDPVAFFEALRPARAACIGQLRNLPPASAHYHMMYVIIAAIDVAAEFFTKRRGFYFGSSPDMIGRNVPPDA